MQVQAQKYEDALPFALRIERELQAVPGVRDVRLGQVLNQPAFLVDVDRERAITQGLTEKDVASSLLTSLTSSQLVAPTFWINPQNNVSYFVAVQTPPFQLVDVPSLLATPVTSAGAPGGEAAGTPSTFGPPTPMPLPPAATPVAPYLGGLASIKRTTTRASIHHESVQPTLDVECGVQGRDLGAVAGDIEAVLRNLGKLPPGVKVRLAGQPETMFSAFGRLALGMILAIALVYLLLVVLFQSWIDPFLIMLAVPASLSGVLWMLCATRTTLNVESLMGAIMAVGIAASNSILLVHFANDQRLGDADPGPVEAAIWAGRTRLRPVLMTALAMILGMLPMALGLGEGGEQNAPLGRAVIGGLLVSTFATLVVIPCAYAVLRRTAPVVGRHDRAVAEADAAGEGPRAGAGRGPAPEGA
ncbi:MAG: efflux RND transporter permease subunit [Myxococcales bacterium]|nr:efflux RND transporter permease subunit [Myxococcales bacterium]